MLLGKQFDAFIQRSPVSVMVQGILERTVAAADLDQLFEDTATVQYSKKLLFSQCVQIMSDVVFRIEPSVGSWYTEHGDTLDVTLKAVYPKLQGIEPQVAAAMVQTTAKELVAVRRAMGSLPRPLLSGYRVRVLDGTHLAGTRRHIFELRRLAAAALPGQALLMYDPRLDLIDEVVPCEDAYTQERTLCQHVLDLVAARDLVVADTAYCTTNFVFGLAARGAFFAIRQHALNVRWEAAGRRRRAGTDEHGRIVYEQAVRLIHPETGEVIEARRISVALKKRDKNGNTELHVLTNVPRADADAVKILSLYTNRWSIETAIQHLKRDLRCEIDTLGYPKAALFGMCVAVLAYNMVSLVKGALRATWGRKFVEEELSMYYLTLNVSKVTGGMLIAIPEKAWTIFRTMSTKEFATTLLELSAHLATHKYQKQKRGPKRKQPKKIINKKHKHFSTSRLIANRQ